MRIYISGAISGMPERNVPAFRAVEALVRRRGHEPVVPHDIAAWVHEGECPAGYDQGGGHSSACWLRTDLLALLYCDAIYMMVGWARSRGASLEHRVAVESGLTVFYEGQRPGVPYTKAMYYDQEQVGS